MKTDLQQKIKEARSEWINLMMQMEENNHGVQKMTNDLYYEVLKWLNMDICSINNCLFVTNSLHDSEILVNKHHVRNHSR